jgi:hypothetical protein
MHDAWSTSGSAPAVGTLTSPNLTQSSTTTPTSSAPTHDLGAGDDGAAEAAPFDPEEVRVISERFEVGDFSVPDAVTTSKTRGSAQKVFAKAVKENYGYRCAITGISTKAFLVASHIVPWADDQTIRTDPSNGVCLSTLVDRAFDSGYLSIGVDSVVKINRDKLSGDTVLEAALAPYDGIVLGLPSQGSPKKEYLSRRLNKR